MAPTTRSSTQARPSVGQPTKSHSDISEEDNHDEDMGDSQDEMEEDQEMGDDDDVDDASEQRPVSSHTEQSLQPLQDTVQRISRQIEDFAKALDKFYKHLKTESVAAWEDTEQLAEKFGEITLARKRDTDSRTSGRRSSSRSRTSSTDSVVEFESQSTQLEANLWSLAKTLLVCQNTQSTTNAQSNQAIRLSELHRYSAPSDIWNAFLDSDQIAQEYECILDWLQERARLTYPPIKEVVAELMENTDRGDATWSAGPLYTKNKIKTQKRQRVWPMPLDPENPGLRTSHVDEESGEPLVTQLDPDAQSRESATLLPQDRYQEEAAWQACWEMLRRGMSLEESRGWWAERKELWRSVVTRSTSSQAAHNVESPWLRIINIASNTEWYDRCKAMCSEADGMSDFERAVFGVLSGDVNTPRKVCTTLDDHLFVVFNSFLIQRYRQYLNHYKARLQEPSNSAYQPPESAFEHVQRHLSSARTEASINDDDFRSLRYLQAALMSHDLDSSFVSLGEAAAQVAHMTHLSDHLMKRDEETPVYAWAQNAASDPDTVRMAAHLQLMLRGLALLEDAYTNQLYVMENNIASYIGDLQRQNKFALIPLYAAKLSPDRQEHVLGAVFMEVVDPQERETMVRLMKHYNIHVSNVAYSVFYQANHQYMDAFDEKDKIIFKPTKVTEYVGPNKVKHIKVRHAYMSEDLTAEEELTIRSVQWFSYVDEEHWGALACWPMVQLYKIYLTRGRLAAANSLRTQASLGDISTKAFGLNLVFTDTSEDDPILGSDDEDGPRPQNMSPSRKKKSQTREHQLMEADTSRAALVSKSSIWCQLEQLVTILDALERWNDFAEELEENRHRKDRMSVIKRGVEGMLQELIECTTPLWDETFLSRPMDETEEVVLTMIRNYYIPECILGYNSALYFAGHALSRTWLVECMNLAQAVAQNSMLTNAFVEGGRMRELVTAFALDSQALLHANEQEINKKSKKSKKENGNFDIWQVSWKEEKPMDLEALD